MRKVPVQNGPDIEGWAIAAAMGLVAFGVSFTVIGLSGMGALAVAGVLFLAVGVIIGLPATPARPLPAVPHMAAQVAAPVAAPVMAAPAPAVAAVKAPAAPMVEAVKPQGLTAARGGKADDLKVIKGIGPKLEELCHTLGYFHYDQIAAWTPAEIAWVDDNLEGFKGRVSRDEWVAQARTLAAGGTV